MDLTPRDIQQKQFHDTFRGYSHEEVDLFLDEVAEAFDRVFRENQSFQHRLTQLEGDLNQARGSEDMLKRMLVTAQETADKAVQEARERATAMVSTSQAKSEEILAGAEKSAGEIVAQATERAKNIVEEAVNKERELQVRIEALKHFESEYRARIKAFIESQLETVDRGAELPEVPGSPASAERSSATHSGAVDAEPSSPEAGVPDVDRPDNGRAPTEQQTVVAQSSSVPAMGGDEEHDQRTQEFRLDEPSEEVPGSDPMTQKVSAGHISGVQEGADVPDNDRSIRELFWGEE